MSGRFVAAMMTTPSAGSKPSISASIWLRVCSRSSWPPPSPAPRLRPMESISSTKMMAGACLRAVWNRSRTRLAPTPTNISMKSDPLTDRNGTPASPATARARRVLPVPGGPTSRIPFGDLGADVAEAVRGLQEVDDLGDLDLDALVAGDVGEGRPGSFGGVEPGPGPADGHDPRHLALGAPGYPEEDPDEEDEDDDGGEPLAQETDRRGVVGEVGDVLPHQGDVGRRRRGPAR